MPYSRHTERFEAPSASTLRRISVHSCMSVCTPSPVYSAPLPPLTGQLAGMTEQNSGCRGADLFDRRFQAVRCSPFRPAFLHLLGQPGTANPAGVEIPSPYQDLLELPLLAILGLGLVGAL